MGRSCTPCNAKSTWLRVNRKGTSCRVEGFSALSGAWDSNVAPYGKGLVRLCVGCRIFGCRAYLILPGPQEYVK